MRFFRISNESGELAVQRLEAEAEAEAVSNAARCLNEEMRVAVGLLRRHTGKVLVTGTRGSVALCRKITERLRAVGTEAYFVHPNHAARGHLGAYRPGDPVLMISAAAGVLELLPLVGWMRYLHSPTIGIVSSGGPILAGEVDVVLGASAALRDLPDAMQPAICEAAAAAISDCLVSNMLQERNGPTYRRLDPPLEAQPKDQIPLTRKASGRCCFGRERLQDISVERADRKADILQGFCRIESVGHSLLLTKGLDLSAVS